MAHHNIIIQLFMDAKTQNNTQSTASMQQQQLPTQAIWPGCMHMDDSLCVCVCPAVFSLSPHLAYRELHVQYASTFLPICSLAPPLSHWPCARHRRATLGTFSTRHQSLTLWDLPIFDSSQFHVLLHHWIWRMCTRCTVIYDRRLCVCVRAVCMRSPVCVLRQNVF